MLEQLTLALSPLVGMLTIVVVLVAGFVIALVKGQSALTLGGIAGFVSPPVAVGVLGIGLVIAMFTSGEVTGFVGIVLAAIMTILTFRSTAAATASREAMAAAREDRAAAALAAKEAADAAREDRAAAALVAKDVAEAASAHAIELAKVSRSVDGMASRKEDEVNALKDIITALRAQLAEEKNTASTLAATHAAAEIAKASTPAPVMTVAPNVEP